MCSTMRLIFNLYSTFNALFNIQLRIQHSTIHFIFNSLFTHSIIYSTISTIYSTFNFNFTLGTRGFSRVRREFSVLAEGRSHERRSREKRPLARSGTFYRHLYANQTGSLQLWSCGPAREEMSNESHYPQKNKLRFKIHWFKRNHDQITSQFSVVDVASV